MADDPYMAGRHPGEPIADYEKRMKDEAGAAGIPVEDYKESLTSEQFRAAAPGEV